jgi:hypothetical protein
METDQPQTSAEPLVERISAKLPAKPADQSPASGAEDQKPIPPEGDESSESEAQTTEQSEAQRQSKFQRRLDRQKSARFQAEAEAKLLREERDRLRSELEGRASAQSQDGEPKRENFADSEDYYRAREEYRVKQAVAATARQEREGAQAREREQQASAAQQSVAKAWTEREAAFKKDAADYEKAVMPFVEEDLGRLRDGARRAIVESELGPQLLYHLATHTDEAERIAELPELRQIAELGKLETQLTRPAKKTTSAPPPAETVRTGRNASGGFRENMSQKEFEAQMKAQGSRWVR